MTSVLDRGELEQSPLADLHLLASELGMDGYRRLRKAELVDAIVVRQGGEAVPAAGGDEDETARPRTRRSRGGRGRSRDADAGTDGDEDAESATRAAEQAAALADEDDVEEGRGRSRRSRGGRGRRGEEASEAPAEEKVAEGVVELMPNGSGFIRVKHPETSDDDVYVSAAQVKRCELVTGDRVAGPLRAPRRSERFPSLVRVDTINGKPADQVAEGTKFDDLPAAFATERFSFGSDDPTLSAVEWLTPFGKGSRVGVVGAARAGKSELLRGIATVLAAQEGIELVVALAGVRPEEVSEWSEAVAPAAAVTLASSPETQAQAVEQVVEQGRRIAARGGDAVIVVDALTHIPPHTARRLTAAARNIPEGGSLTIIAATGVPLGGETTVIALDAALTAQRRFPALDLTLSGTMRAEQLLGDQGAEEIARKRAEVEAQRAA